MKLSEKSLIPLYQQVMDDLKKAIDAGVYAPNHKIPSEAELSAIYSVSRITVRRAVEELAASGHLTKKQGKGTYVNPPKLARKIWQPSSNKSFTDVCRDDGREPGARVVSVETIEARPAELEALGLAEGSSIISVRRVRTADGVPVMLENNFFPATEEFAFLLAEDLNDVSLFDLVRRRSGHVAGATSLHTIEAIRASGEMVGELSVGAGEPILYERTNFLDECGHPLMTGRNYIVGSLSLFEI